MVTATAPGSAPAGQPLPLILMRLALASFLFAGMTLTIADADLWGHLLFGRDILRLGGLPSHDYYSFTSDIAWVNHEWLAEVITYGAYAIGGSAGLVTVKSLVVLGMLASVLVALRRVSADFVVHDLLVFLAVAGTYGRAITFRPQVFSLLLFSALLLALLTAERGRQRALLAVPFIFLLWTNLHGGWIVGMAAFGIWGAWAFIRHERYGIDRRWLAGAGAASLVATLGNPHGLELWHFLGTTVRVGRDIADWQPLWKFPIAAILPWLTASILVAVTVVFERRRIQLSHVCIVAMCWIGSIRVNRIDAFFVLSAVMLLGPAIGSAFRRFVRASAAAVPVRKAGSGKMALAALVIGLTGVAVRRSNFQCIDIAKSAPEQEAVLTVKAAHLQGRMLTFFDWGEYAIWHLAPGIKISMDGRRETVYSDDLVSAHFRLYRNEPGALTLVDRLQPDYIWLPSRFPVVKTLESAGWIPIFRGPKSTILARSAPAMRSRAEPVPGGPRCFPGP